MLRLQFFERLYILFFKNNCKWRNIRWIEQIHVYRFNVRCFSIDFLAIECCYLLVSENKLFPLQTTIFFFGRNDAFSVCLRFSSAFSIRFSSQVIILFKNRICAVSSDFRFSFSQFIHFIHCTQTENYHSKYIFEFIFFQILI